MKRVVLSYLLILVFFSCEKEETMVVINSDITPPAINAPVADSELIITEPKLNDEIQFEWTETGYGVSTEVTYTIEADAGCNSFAHPWSSEQVRRILYPSRWGP